LLAGSTDFNIHDTIIEISWEDDGGKSGETTLLNHNNTEFCHEILEFKEIEDSPRIYIKETIFDHMEKTIPSDINIFWYDTLRDMKEYTTSDGILTPGDIINIFFNFTHFSNPPTGGGLNPGSCVQIKLIPKHGVPTLEQFYVPETFPKEGEWIQL
jgi:archaellin